MPIVSQVQLSPFAEDILNGLTRAGQKILPPKYFYDDLGSKLFEAITHLPEYGLARADARVLERAAKELSTMVGSPCLVAELGSGSGRKTSHILGAITEPGLKYYPIDVSNEALTTCCRELAEFANIEPIRAEYMEGLARLSKMRPEQGNLLLLFVGSSIGNFEPAERKDFLRRLHQQLRPGDLFLLGADLVKNIDQMLVAYDDPTGVTASFNLNILARINRELDANFDLKTFEHQAIWNGCEHRIEMHLVSRVRQRIDFRSLRASATFEAGETIWTESSHKFRLEELREAAMESGFKVLETWTDEEWPFAESLWQA